ncbi:conserved hypothetical protein [Ricinus communis]|uniref:Uncharacterized protein n=1 Tax=Ricinus communis TaxID=3988 RepID=B9RKX8_RICCO|nr:conserved hypothetical protein [Ricinus communis]
MMKGQRKLSDKFGFLCQAMVALWHGDWGAWLLILFKANFHVCQSSFDCLESYYVV